MVPLEQGRNMQLRELSDPSGGADSGVIFGASMLIIVGVFQIIQGIAAIANGDFFGEAPDYALQMNVTAWGWVHLLLGVLLAVVGFYLFKGSRSAGIAAIVFAGLSAVANFLFIPHYPFWTIIIVLIDIWVVWAIAASGILARPPSDSDGTAAS